jgi:type I restriction enzyme R subunit
VSDYSEDSLVEKPAISLFAELGWETVNGFHEFDQIGDSPLGREAKSEVVLAVRLRPVLERLNHVWRPLTQETSATTRTPFPSYSGITA